MYQNKYVFAQLIDFLPYENFKYIIKKYKGNKGIVAIVAKMLKTERTIYEILQILGKSQMDKIPVNKLINKYDCKNFK